MNLHLLHHWLVSMRGGEKVLEQFCQIFPRAPIHTLVHTDREEAISETIRTHPVHTTFLNKLPGATDHYKSWLPLLPFFIKNHKVDADFILSSDAGWIKGIDNKNDAPHVCYCHSPPRYLWDMQQAYLEKMPASKRAVFKAITPYLQNFDRQSAEKVDHFIANSAFVKERIERIYGRAATVIHPPVDVEAFNWKRPSEEFYLIVAALVPYKKVDLAVRAFNKMGKPLIIIGNGSERTKLQELAKRNVQLLGSQPFEVLKDYFERCKAFIFPGVEDFGITPLEAQAAGKPVIAYRAGGALETIKENETGLFFDEQQADSLVEAVAYFEDHIEQFDPQASRQQAEAFRPQKFRNQIKDFLSNRYPSYFSAYGWEQQVKTNKHG